MTAEEKILELLGEVKADLIGLNVRLDRMETAQAQTQYELTQVRCWLEQKVETRLDRLNGSVDAIAETMISKSRVERLEDDVMVLKTALNGLTRKVAELEQYRRTT